MLPVFLYLIICTRLWRGDASPDQGRDAQGWELPGRWRSDTALTGALADPDQGPDSGQGCQRRLGVHTHADWSN